MSLDPDLLERARKASVLLPLDFLGLLRLEGPDVADYLQRVSSQDAEGLSVGCSASDCLLTGKGKLLAWFRLLRLGQELFYAETLRDQLPALRELLDRYIFTEKIELTVLEEHAGLGLIGPEAPGLCTAPGLPLELDEVREEEGLLRVRSDELGIPFCRIYGLEVRLLDERQGLIQEGIPVADRSLFEAMRIDAGVALFGVDADETTIPLEVGMDEACHPTKGCYTGQEVVARIRTYGHVNRKLMKVRYASELPFEPGSLIYDEGMEAGRLTSAWLSPDDNTWHGLALLPLAVTEEDTDLRIGVEDGPRIDLV